MSKKITTKNVRANGLNFLVGTAGIGPPLLFLTGTGGDLRKPTTPLLSPLVDRFTVITYDQRGMGQSDKPDSPYSMLDYAQDAMAILDELEYATVHLAGYSFGGMVAQEVAISWPERIAGLALMATTAGGAGGKSAAIEKFENLPAQQRAQERLAVLDLEFTPEWQLEYPDAASARIAMFIAAEQQFAHEPGHAIGRQRQLEARSHHNTYDRLHLVKSPTLVICGDRDGQARFDAQRAMADRISDCQFELVHGSHQMISENPNVNQMLIEFLLGP